MRSFLAALVVCLFAFNAEARTRHQYEMPMPVVDIHDPHRSQSDFVALSTEQSKRVRVHRKKTHESRKAKSPSVKIVLATASPDIVISEKPGAVDIPAEVIDGENSIGPDAEAKDGDDELARARAYLVRTATPGGTMSRIGAKFAVDQLHPTFVRRMAAAIREARGLGLHKAGIFSCYRPPGLGVGGFRDKFNSLHSYGLAADLTGIGGAGSSNAKLWNHIAVKHKLYNPYGPNNWAEFNHYQATRLTMISHSHALRRTITAKGARDLQSMWRVGALIIDQGPTARRYARHHRHHGRHRSRYASAG